MQDFILQIIIVLVLMICYNFVANKILKGSYLTIFAGIISLVTILFGVYVLNLSAEDFGFSNILNGLLYGGALSIILAGAITFGSKFKKTKSFFADVRVMNVSSKKLLQKTLIDIPISTVLFEEILFRGLILGFLLTQTTELWAIIGSSILFGLWHILPALDFSAKNEKAKGLPLATVIGTVIFTGATGIVFAWLRVESGSIVAPMLIHFVSNSGSFAASWFSLNSLRT